MRCSEEMVPGHEVCRVSIEARRESMMEKVCEGVEDGESGELTEGEDVTGAGKGK